MTRCEKWENHRTRPGNVSHHGEIYWFFRITFICFTTDFSAVQAPLTYFALDCADRKKFWHRSWKLGEVKHQYIQVESHRKKPFAYLIFLDMLLQHSQGLLHQFSVWPLLVSHAQSHSFGIKVIALSQPPFFRLLSMILKALACIQAYG